MDINVKSLIVKYHDKIVGYLKDDGKVISFQYDSKWLKEGFSISPFSLPLTNKTFISNSIYLKGLYGVFWDCLPQGWGCRVLQKKLFKLDIDYSKLSFLTKLSMLSNSPRGALRFEPTTFKFKESKSINLDLLNEYVVDFDQINTDKVDDKFVYYSSTSGGAKPKVHAVIDNENWIIKLNSKLKTSGEEEYKANELASKCGINVAKFKLFKSNNSKGYFGSKRFDIDKNNKPIHMISLCGLLESTPQIPNLDYKNLFQVINIISINKNEDLYEAFKRMSFNVLFGNKDDHGCNWAFLYDEKEKGYRLSPFYDITNTKNIYPEHEMSVLGNGKPTIDDLLELAKHFNLSISKCKEIIEKIKSTIDL